MKVEDRRLPRYLRERWEAGVVSASRLFRELEKRAYSGGHTQVNTTVREWRREGQERAFVRFETAPGGCLWVLPPNLKPSHLDTAVGRNEISHFGLSR